MLYGGWPEDAQDAGPARYGPQAANWHKIEEQHTLGWLLSQSDYVIPGIPVLFVTAQGSDFRDRLLSGEIPLL